MKKEFITVRIDDLIPYENNPRKIEEAIPDTLESMRQVGVIDPIELAYTNLRSVVRQFTMASEKVNRIHPTQKPVRLFSEIIKKFDKKNQFGKIVDLFGGSGSTIIACEQLNKKCYMCELDPHYVDVIIDRWEQFTGKKAELID